MKCRTKDLRTGITTALQYGIPVLCSTPQSALQVTAGNYLRIFLLLVCNSFRKVRLRLPYSRVESQASKVAG